MKDKVKQILVKNGIKEDSIKIKDNYDHLFIRIGFWKKLNELLIKNLKAIEISVYDDDGFWRYGYKIYK
ncbi:MAG: hypothetical protein KC414_11145 [Romboutsia sp.]|nr:hypothetical protein [Romboutsia sp.]